jgi:hydrophobic/amphiphilic exporter-1 (mainly G- bacteria), HAE1 family
VDREKLAAYGLSVLDVRNAIDRSNVTRTAGTLTAGAAEAVVRVDSRAGSAQDVLNYPITTVGGSGGQPGPGATPSADGTA